MRDQPMLVLDDGSDRPVLPWRFVVGVLLHCIIPAWLVTLVCAIVLTGPASLTTAGMADVALSASLKFLAVYGPLVLVAALLARLVDPALRRRRARRFARDPAAAAIRSARCLKRATATIARVSTGAASSRLGDTVAAIGRASWRHEDPRYQALSADLDQAAQVFATACASATPDRQPQIVALAETAFDHILQNLHALSADRSRLDEGDARTIAGYIDLRYGDPDPADLAGRLPH